MARAELPSAPPNDETSAEPDVGRIMGGGEESEKVDVDREVQIRGISLDQFLDHFF